MANKRKGQREDGLFQYQLYLGTDGNGKRKTKTFYGKSKKEAREKAEDYKRGYDIASGTFRAIANNYLEHLSHKVTESIYKDKEFRINQFISVLGSKDISKIESHEIEAILEDLGSHSDKTGRPMSQTTLKYYLQAINAVFTFAIQNRIISYNPCDFVEIPSGTPKQERGALTQEQRQIIEGIDHKAVLPAMIMMYCGLRRGELAALTWNDVDFDNKLIYVRRSYDYHNSTFKSPKTASGVRIVPIPNRLLPLLEKAKKGQKNGNFVVLSDDGEMMRSASWRNFLDGLNARAGFEFTWHQLRHTYATVLYDAEVDVLTAQKLLGHSDAKTTMSVYTHLSQEKQKLSIEKLNDFLG